MEREREREKKCMRDREEYVKQISKEALTVAEHLSSATEDNILHILDDDEEDPAESG